VEDSNGKIRAFGNLGSVLSAQNDRHGSIKMFDRQLQVAEQMGDHVGQTNALGSLGEYGVQGILTEGRISTVDLLVLTSS
jgi:hypothetical protein